MPCKGLKIQVEQVEKIAEQVWEKLGLSVCFFMAGLPDEKWGERLALVLEGATLPLSQEKKILAAFSQKIRPYEVPKEVIYLTHFEETKTGKIKRKASLQRHLLTTEQA